MGRTMFLSITLLALAGAGCTEKSVSVEKELADKRFAQLERLDALYAAYGQGELAAAVHKKALQSAEKSAAEEKTQADKDVTRELMTALSSAALEMDRSAFDEHCIDLGRGQRPSILSPKARAFFADKATLDKCRDIAQVQFEIEALETELKRLKALPAE